ncbi:MAG: cobalt transporter [Alphaproteobacteria bacterium]|nr:cobalt transporter [Alphaproteobacteria bacterium]
MFTRIALAALVAGLLAGGVVALAQTVGTTDLILAAEAFETATDSHDDTWAPADGFERFAATAGADLVTGIGFAFLLVSAFALRGRPVGWRNGILWGLAGFAVFSALPALGLPPELPGAAAAPLAPRQLWWLLTVAASGVGLGALAFAKPSLWKVAGVVLIALPHLIGAPVPDTHGGLAPATLVETFVLASLATAAVFWLVLGAVAGVAYDRLGPRSA